MCPIEPSDLDLIDELLQMNQTSPSIQELWEKARKTTVNNPWTLDNSLIKYQEQLVVAEDNDLQT